MPESIGRVPQEENRARRFTEKVGTIFDSLFRKGQLVRVEPVGREIAYTIVETDQMQVGNRIFGRRPGYGMWGG